MEQTALPFPLTGEDDYKAVMENECAAWLEREVRTQTFKSFDGVKLCAYYAAPEGAKTCVVMVHGFCEFFGKYHEMAWYLYRAGYAFAFLEVRGHGHSGGKLLEADVVHVDSFDTYVQDLHAFAEQVVHRHFGDLTWVLFAHSMGGAISTLFLETYPDMFVRALLSSPMYCLRKLKLNRPAAAMINAITRITHREKTLAPAEKYFDEMEAFETSSMQSKARYDYTFRLRLQDIHNRSYGASLGWGLAAVKAMRTIMEHADRVRIPVTIFAAGNDILVDTDGFERFKQKAPQTEILWYPSSKHEIYNALNDERFRFYEDFFRRLQQSENE